MADTPESKAPFWSSLPGILTGAGGLLAALTGLIIAWNQLGSKPNSNSVPPVNSIATLASAPGASPSNADNDRYKSLAGKWEVIEKLSEENGGDKVTWHFDATVSENELTLKGKMLARNGDKNLDEDDENTRSTLALKLMDLSGLGTFTETADDVATSYRATIRLDAESPKFTGSVEAKGEVASTLTGRKLER
jgi:hypothetical protein